MFLFYFLRRWTTAVDTSPKNFIDIKGVITKSPELQTRIAKTIELQAHSPREIILDSEI